MLPHIAPYAIPGGFRLAQSRPGWRPEPARAALLVHDMQNYFVSPFDIAPEALIGRVVSNIATLREQARELNIPVIFSAQPGGQDRRRRGLLQDFWGDGPPPDPEAVAIVAALDPTGGDLQLTKTRYSAFAGTPLAELLGSRDQLVVTGVYAHIGVLATALDAFMRDIQPFVVADAVADFGPEHHRQALRHVADRCGVVATTTEVADSLLTP